MVTAKSFKVLQYFFSFISWLGAFAMFGVVVGLIVPLVEVDSRLAYTTIMLLTAGAPALLMFLTYRQLARLFKLLREKLAISLALIQTLRKLAWLFLISFAAELVLHITFALTKVSHANLYRHLELSETDAITWIELAFPTLGAGVGSIILFFAFMGLAQFFSHHTQLQQKVHTLEEEAALTV